MTRGVGESELVGTWVAATAIEHGLTLVTRNTQAFQPPGIALLDPWAG